MSFPTPFQQVDQVPENYPSDWIEQVQLSNNLTVLIRPIRPDDAGRLQEGFQRLSPQSRYLRFLQTSNQMSDKQAYQLANLDYNNRMALVAEMQVEDGIVLVGVARYARLGPDRPDCAECAVVVADDIQQHGLGSILMNRLGRYAAAHDIHTFFGTIHVTNAAMLRFIKRAGLPYQRVIIEPGIWEVRVQLGG